MHRRQKEAKWKKPDDVSVYVQEDSPKPEDLPVDKESPDLHEGDQVVAHFHAGGSAIFVCKEQKVDEHRKVKKKKHTRHSLNVLLPPWCHTPYSL